MRPKKEKKFHQRQKIMSTGFVDFKTTFSLRRLGVNSKKSSGKCVLFSPFLPLNVVSFFPPQRASSSSSSSKKKKRNPVDRSSKSATTPRRPEKKKKKKKKKKKRAPRDAETRETPHQSARPFSERTTTTTFLRLLFGEKKGNGKVEVLLLLRFLSKGFSSDIFLVGRRRGPRGETRRSLFLSKKKTKKKKKSRFFCPFARRLGKARCSFDRVSFLRRPKLPRAP